MRQIRAKSLVGTPLIILGALFAAACGSADPDRPAAAVKILSFEADPSHLEGPGKTTLSWKTEGAVSLGLIQDGSGVSLEGAPIDEGSIEVDLERNTTFELVAMGRGGKSTSRTLTVVVDGLPPTIGSFTGPAAVAPDDEGKASVTLAWTEVVGADELTLEVGGGPTLRIDPSQLPDGAIEVVIDESTLFTLVATNEWGTTTATHEVILALAPVIDSFTVDREWVGIGDTVNVEWDTTGAERVELWLNGNRVDSVEPTAVDGSAEVAIHFDSTISLRAYNLMDELTTATVEVTVGLPEIERFTGSATSLWIGETIEFEWETDGGSRLVITAPGLDEPICEVTDVQAVRQSSCGWEPPVGDFLISLTVENGSGSVSASWTLEVGSGPRIVEFWGSPTQLGQGDEITLNWITGPDPAGQNPTLVLIDHAGVSHPIDELSGSLSLEVTSGPGPVVFTLEASTEHPLSRTAVAEVEAVVFGQPEVSLSANPDHFDHTVEEVLLRWTTTYVTSLVIYEVREDELVEVLEVPEAALAQGEVSLAPLDDTTYRAVAANFLGLSAEDEITITVAPPEVVRFEADRSQATIGEGILLEWETRMAEKVDLDVFGQTYVVGESQDPYLDVAAMGGTHLPLTDECGPPLIFGCARLAFPAGFRFPFGGELHEEIRVYHNGYLSFDVEHKALLSMLNTPLPVQPTSMDLHVHMAVFWDWLGWNDAKYPAGNIHYLLDEDPTRGRFLVVQWKDIHTYNEAFPQVSLQFEVVLWESGAFEYRYGPMDPGNNATQEKWEISQGYTATIGYQDLELQGHTIRFDQGITTFGSLVDRTFTYTPVPTIERSGSYLWYPLATDEVVTATLRATRGTREHTATVEVQLLEAPEVFLRERPEAAVLAGSTFRLGWSSHEAVSIQVVDQDGTVRCTAQDELALEQGYCALQETVEGPYRYRLVATGDNGAVREKVVDVDVYRDFGIQRFEADRGTIAPGQDLELSWEIQGGDELSLLSNGVEIFKETNPGGIGSFTHAAPAGATVYVLRLTNSLGMVVEEELELWDVELQVSASATQVRPGEATTVTITASAVGGGAAPAVFGTFPLEEVQGGPAFGSIVTLPGVKLVEDGEVVELPAGFEFPYFARDYQSVRVSTKGYLSFDPAGAAPAANGWFPNEEAVHLAPFWDSLEAGSAGSVLMAATGPDEVVIEWRAMSQKYGTTIIPSELNFQVALRRDGSFEFRYGEMRPPAAPFEDDSCFPSSCVNEAMGSRAAIGYQAVEGFDGHTHHLGGVGGGSSNQPFPGGLSNRTFRYSPRQGGGSFELRPLESQVLRYCIQTAIGPACRSVEIEAGFGVHSFTADERFVQYGESTFLRWSTFGGSRVRVLGAGGLVLFDSSEQAIVDSGSVQVSPESNQTYVLELTAGFEHVEARAMVEVERMSMVVTAPATSFPGAPVTISWDLSIADSNLDPVVVTPLEERSDLPFAALDISADESATVIFGDGVTAGIQQLDFEEGFTFPFLGRSQSSVRIAVEGYLSFDSSATSSSNVNQFLPNASTTYRRVHLAPFWDDLSTHTQGRVLAKRWDADTYVIQWSRVSPTVGSSSENEYSLNFMVVLRRNGDFEFRYGNMSPPPSFSEACRPLTCENEANGSLATIGYQDPTGTLGHLLHFGGSLPGPDNKPMPGGLSGRSFRFTLSNARTGSVVVNPWDLTYYDICALEPSTGEIFCPEGSVRVDASWGIAAFDATPWNPGRNQDFSLSWEVLGLDELVLLRNDVLVFRQEGDEVVSQGNLQQSATEKATYLLRGVSLGRTVEVVRVVEPRGFDLDVVTPPGPYLPGQTVTIDWTLSQLEPGTAAVNTPMVEIPAGPGEAGAFQDVSHLPGATVRTPNDAVDQDRWVVDIPFTFPFFGESFTRAQIHVDGYLSFDVAEVSGVGANLDLPNRAAGPSRVHLAPFWDDFALRGPEELWTYAPDADTFIIQWTHFSRAAGSTAEVHYDMNWQVVLHADGSFEYRYGKLAAPAQPFSHHACFPNSCELEAQGSSATVGYQRVDASFGHTLHYGGEGAAGVRPFPGGLGNRSFRYQVASSGSIEVEVDRYREVEICGVLGTYSTCELVALKPIAEPGDLMFTELMLDPAQGANARWFEVRNLTRETIDLQHFEFHSPRGSYTVSQPTPIPPKGYAVFAASSIPGHAPAGIFGSALELDPVTGWLELRVGPSVIAEVEWSFDWDVPQGRSLYLDSSAQLRGRTSTLFPQWCVGDEGGSPGAGELGCLGRLYSVDPNGEGALVDISQVGINVRAFDQPNKVARLRAPDFEWEFYGEPVRWIAASGNGWLSFADRDPVGGANRNPTTFPRAPTVTPPSPVLAAFWDQLVCTPTVHDCGFTYFYGDLGGEKVFVAEWRDFRRTTAVGGLTFQAQLYPNGDVKVVFGDVYSADHPDSVNAGYYRGSAAWIGFENVGRDDYVTALHHEEVDLSHRVFHFIRR